MMMMMMMMWQCEGSPGRPFKSVTGLSMYHHSKGWGDKGRVSEKERMSERVRMEGGREEIGRAIQFSPIMNDRPFGDWGGGARKCWWIQKKGTWTKVHRS